jgi:hypothetical protein
VGMLDEYLASVQAEGMGTEDYNSAKTPDHIERFNRETEGWTAAQLSSAGIDFIMGAYRHDPMLAINTCKIVYGKLACHLVYQVVGNISRTIANASYGKMPPIIETDAVSAYPEGTTFND